MLPQQGGNLAHATQLHIHDVPIWISDSNIISVLTPYGKIQRDHRHGRKQLQSGAYMSTGVRFASFEQKPGMTLPRTLRTSDGTHVFRVTREGDAPLCSNCQSYFHTTEECRKSKSDDTTKPSEPVSRPARRWEASTPAAELHVRARARARDSATENDKVESQDEDERASHADRAHSEHDKRERGRL